MELSVLWTMFATWYLLYIKLEVLRFYIPFIFFLLPSMESIEDKWSKYLILFLQVKETIEFNYNWIGQEA